VHERGARGIDRLRKVRAGRCAGPAGASVSGQSRRGRNAIIPPRCSSAACSRAPPPRSPCSVPRILILITLTEFAGQAYRIVPYLEK
jgi:hypothetical protein